MICDTLSNRTKYSWLPPRLVRGLELLTTVDWNSLSEGKHFFEDELLFAMVQDYQPKPMSEGKWEAHRRYTDIQYLVSGEELIGFGDVATMKVTEPFAPDGDIAFFDGSGDFLRLGNSRFTILFPQDAHMPSITTGKNCSVRKVVLKVDWQTGLSSKSS